MRASVAGVHRGGGPHIGAENTIEAFQRCVAFGARLLELDVRMTRDGHCVLMHDSAVGRTTDGQGDVCGMLLSEIQALDAAYWIEGLRGTGIRVPTLVEFLDEFVPDERLHFLLDFKDIDSIVAAFAVLEPMQIEHRLILGSVFAAPNECLLRLRHSAPVCTDTTESIAIIMAYSVGLLPYHTLRHDIFGFILRSETRWVWTQELVAALHARGMKVMVCGTDLDDPVALRRCLEWQCDYILTDSPDVLQRVMHEVV